MPKTGVVSTRSKGRVHVGTFVPLLSVVPPSLYIPHLLEISQPEQKDQEFERGR